MKKRSYQDYEGVVFKYYHNKHNMDCTLVRVLICDEHVGLTVVEDADESKRLICVNGPSSPLWRKHYSEKNYRQGFQRIIESIDKGFIHVSSFSVDTRLMSQYIPSSLCAFSQ